MSSANFHDLPERGTSRRLNGLRVLIVEDSWPVAAAFKRLLERSGAVVAGPVATVADATHLISEHPIDAALVDICLRGGEKAYDLIDQLHDRGARIVVVTGYGNVALLPEKVAEVLHKPVDGQRVLQSLSKSENADVGQPATLRYADRSVDCTTLREALLAWMRLPERVRKQTTIEVGGTVYTAEQVDRWYNAPKQST